MVMRGFGQKPDSVGKFDLHVSFALFNYQIIKMMDLRFEWYS
jgi:hypothetical protein